MTNERTNADIASIEKSARFFFDRGEPVHIKKTNGWFHNGFISEIQGTIIMLVDEREGEIPVFCEQIEHITKRIPKEFHNAQ